MDISTNELRYAAGFFDGEGCIQINPKKSQPNTFVVEVRITNTNLEVLEWFKVRFGGSVGRQTPNKKVKKNKPTWYWAVASRIANAFLKTIIQFLVLKREQAQIAIDFQARIKRGTNRLSEEEISIRRAMSVQVDELKELQHLVLYMNLPDVFYIAGFLDAESNIIIYRVRRNYELAIDITNTNKSVLALLKEKYGGAIIEKRDTDGRNYPCFDWSIQGDSAIFFVSTFQIALICKRNQIALANEFQQKKDDLKKAHKLLCDHTHVFIQYKNRMSALNHGVEWVPFGTHS